MTPLPKSGQEIADVIGRDRALFLIGQLPRCSFRDKRWPNAMVTEPILYVPKRIKPDHKLVDLVGWDAAVKLVKAFGGEILKPKAHGRIIAEFKIAATEWLARDGHTPQEVAEILSCHPRTIQNRLKDETPREEPKPKRKDFTKRKRKLTEASYSHGPERRC